jgi:hypothetical protein
MCLRRAPEKYIAGAALDRADVQGRRLARSKSVFWLRYPSSYDAEYTINTCL